MKLFLSYGRGDDESFVLRLANDLKARGFDVWLDRWSMPSRALTFMDEIRRAIDESDRLVVVIGPATAKSDYVRSEWQYGLVRAKAVTPVLRLGEYTIVPAELQGFHCPDCRPERGEHEAFAEIARVLSDPVPALGTTYGIPSLPPHFRPRPDRLSELTAGVLEDHGAPTVLDSWGRLTVVSGMGGVGKSVLAAAFARSTRARRAFSDGIYWRDARNDPNPVDLADALVRELDPPAGEQPDGGPSETTEARLRSRLLGRRCLVVLDNVSDLDQIELLARCLDTTGRLLVTTREAHLVEAGRVLPLGGLSAVEGRHLLRDWVGEDEPSSEVRFLVKRCDGLPFAIALCGAMAAAGVPLAAIAERLRAEDLGFLEKRFPEYPYPSLLPMLDASREALHERDPQAAERLVTLAVFREGARVPVLVVDALWAYDANLSQAETSKAETTKTVVLLENLSLVRLEGSGERRAIVLHPLVRDYLVGLAPALEPLHRRLLHAYADATGPDLHAGPDDGYYHASLAHHLLGAGRDDDLHALLTESPEWMRVKDRDRRARGSFLADLDLAIGSFDPTAGTAPSSVLARLFAARHVAQRGPSTWGEALLRTLVILGDDVTALAAARANLDRDTKLQQLLVVHAELRAQGRPAPELIEELDALVAAEQDPERRARGHELLIEAAVRSRDLRRAVALWEADGPSDRARAYLAPLLVTALAQAGSLDDARRIADTSSTEARVLVDVHQRLAADEVAGATRIAESAPDGVARQMAVTTVVRRLVDAGRHEEALRLAGRLDGATRIAVTASIPKERYVAWALAEARDLADPVKRAIGLMACADALERLRGAPPARRTPAIFRRRGELDGESPDAIRAEIEQAVDDVEPAQRTIALRFLVEGALRRRDPDASRLLETWRTGVESLTDRERRAVRLAELAQVVAQSGDVAAVRAALNSAVRAAEEADADESAEAALGEVLVAAARGGRLPLAVSLASTMQDERRRNAALERLAAVCADAGLVADIEHLLAGSAAELRDELGCEYARALAVVGMVERSLLAAESVSPHSRGRALSDVAVTLAAGGRAADAREAADRLLAGEVSPYWQTRAFCAIARSETGSRAATWLARAHAAAAAAEGAVRAWSLTEVAAATAEITPADTGVAFEQAIRAAREVEDDPVDSFMRARTSQRALERVVRALLDSGRIDDGVTLARSIDTDEAADERLRASLVAHAAALRARTDDKAATSLFREALELALSIERSMFSPSWRFAALHEVATRLLEASRTKQALETLDRSNPSVDAYIAGFAAWCTPSGAAAAEFGIEDLASVAAIIGWIRRDWAELAASLGAAPDDSP
jgi:TIR domain/NB-ARC domain